MSITIHLASDHAGFEMKEFLKLKLTKDYAIVDHGALVFESNDDFNEYVSSACREVIKGGEHHRAIIFGGSGQGEAMMANRHKGIRAAVYYHHNLEIIKLSRMHNNANVLSVASRFISNSEISNAVDLWLDTLYNGQEKYQRRNLKLDN